MNTRQKIRAIVILTLTFVIFVVAVLAGFFPIYLLILKELTLPYIMVISGYFGVEGIKNYKK